MTMKKARLSLVAVFFSDLIIHWVAFVYAFLKGRIYFEQAQDLCLTVRKVYSVHFAVILGAMFVKKRREKTAEPHLFWPALGFCVAWNLLSLWPSIAFGFFGESKNTDVSRYLDSIPAASSFLIVGTLSFLFTREPEERKN